MFLLFNLVVVGIFMNIAGHTWALLIALVEPQTSLAYNAEAAARSYRWRQFSVDTYPAFVDILFKQFICFYLLFALIVLRITYLVSTCKKYRYKRVYVLNV